jgi:hypothetical protein
MKGHIKQIARWKMDLIDERPFRISLNILPDPQNTEARQTILPGALICPVHLIACYLKANPGFSFTFSYWQTICFYYGSVGSMQTYK